MEKPLLSVHEFIENILFGVSYVSVILRKGHEIFKGSVQLLLSSLSH